MIHTITARNVNGALSEGMLILASNVKSEPRSTRNGPAMRANGPVVIETAKPMERVLFSPARNANPFFHLFESLWMLAGRNDLPWLAQFNKQMATYSDDGGKTQPAAYGFRWTQHFGHDQIDAVVEHLTQDPNSRRAVIAMWDGGSDLSKATAGSKDVPCNTHMYFGLRATKDGSVLDMTISCRSNDALWGAHGANAVHFSVLQEYLAARLSVTLDHPIGVGRMVQFANDYHYYLDIMKESPERLAIDASDHDNYTNLGTIPLPMFSEPTNETIGDFERSLQSFVVYADPIRNPVLVPANGGGGGKRAMARPELSYGWFNAVALPMLAAWDSHKQTDYDGAIRHVRNIEAVDWGAACYSWMDRAMHRAVKRKESK